MPTTNSPHNTRWQEIQTMWKENQWLYVMVGFLFGVVFVPSLQSIGTDINQFLQSLAPEAIGIGFTVLIIDRLYQRREQQKLKERLIRDMGSSANEIAKRAVEELKTEGWLEDASLQGRNFRNANLQGARIGFGRDYLNDAEPQRAVLRGVNLRRANLEKAKLHHVDLKQANLSVANLREVNLYDADLSSVDLFEANLYNADLRGAQLSGAILHQANLKQAKLEDIYAKAKFSEDTMLPDGNYWTQYTDMKRYIDSTHPEFWEPNWVKEEREKDE